MKTIIPIVAIFGAGVGAYILFSKKKKPTPTLVEITQDAAVKVGEEIVKHSLKIPPFKFDPKEITGTIPPGEAMPPFKFDPKKIGELIGGAAGSVAFDTKIPFTWEGVLPILNKGTRSESATIKITPDELDLPRLPIYPEFSKTGKFSSPSRFWDKVFDRYKEGYLMYIGVGQKGTGYYRVKVTPA